MAKIGFIGAGKMGVGVVLNLCAAGHDLTVLLRANRQFEAEISEAGAAITSELSDCIAEQDHVFMCLPSMDAWQEVVSEVDRFAKSCAFVVDLTSARPDLTEKVSEKLRQKGIGFIDAPMLKGPSAARAATIQLLVGGNADDITSVMPLLEAISEEQHLTGASGTGHALKLINNAVTLTNSAIVYETFALAASMGIDLTLAHRAMQGSAASSKRLDAIAPVLISGKHTPSFDIGTALKDLELYTEMVRNKGTLSPVGSGAQTIYRLGTMFGLQDAPVTRLGEMLFDLNSGKIDDVGDPGTIHKNSQN